MNQHGKKIMPRTSRRHENLKVLDSSRKDVVICKPCNRPKGTVTNSDFKSLPLDQIMHSGKVKVLYQAKPIRTPMPQAQTSNLPILKDDRTLLGPKENFYSKNVVDMMMVEVKPIEPLESGNQDGSKETEEIRSNETLGTNTNVERNPVKRKEIMTCQDEQRQITRSMSKGVTIGENVQIPIEGSSSEKILSPTKDSKRLSGKVIVMVAEVESDGREKLAEKQ
ncbi:hypothetical protein ACH5RR_015993 [Cinchona calisaya]|uniref:Uncharacterized protein n=1 Tax=Cinchona calisaya TaxID=153742 RepID=A0ABD2ZVM1_9GENT